MQKNDEARMTNDERMPNDKEATGRLFVIWPFVIRPSFGIRILAFFVVVFLFAPALSHGAENLGILGAHPQWSVLEKYQETITREDFSRLIHNVYCTHGFAPDLIEINEKTARLLMNREAQTFFTLRFAANDAERRPVPRLWRPAKSLPSAKPEKPLSGLKIALDPGHLGGKW